MTRRVVIVQELLPQYRVPFFDGLRTELAKHDVELCLVHGRASGARAQRRDEAALPWATIVVNKSRSRRSRDFAVWQPALGIARSADLVIVEHANRLLLNHLLLLASPRRLAYWGHGGNLQTERTNSLAERFKRWTALRADWWFAYTDGAANRVMTIGFPAEKITVVQNSIAYSGNAREPQSPPELYDQQAIFVGALHPHKGIEYLLEAARLIASNNSEFKLVILGNGPLKSVVEKKSLNEPWIDYRGAVFGPQQHRAVSQSSVLLIPGAVGLVVLDSFHAGTPICTIADRFHGPEYEYLSDQNSIRCRKESTPLEYADRVLALLADPDGLALLSAACLASAEKYTLTAMIKNFATGILKALEKAPK